ncbi:lactose-binding lectin l-2-like protein, partial [Leptotrombidium deliense]
MIFTVFFTLFVSLLVANSEQTTHIAKKCPKQWHNFRDEKCIKYMPVNVNNKDAIELCARERSSLVSIQSQEEDSFIVSVARKYRQFSNHFAYETTRAWIAAKRLKQSSNIFVWPNGDYVSYARWGQGCSVNDDCVAMQFHETSNSWCDYSCNQTLADAICEISLLPQAEETEVD